LLETAGLLGTTGSLETTGLLGTTGSLGLDIAPSFEPEL